ncbi:uncharacterized protein G2W53_024727 [Senna tora]|uniref:Uncharacterized protein n=1 Tax=Senna tora TaxID=362788 RepID=A0A834TE18_9FABA|nr:uncharacterized protein G2W53_024727 [Senna tora]
MENEHREVENQTRVHEQRRNGENVSEVSWKYCNFDLQFSIKGRRRGDLFFRSSSISVFSSFTPSGLSSLVLTLTDTVVLSSISNLSADCSVDVKAFLDEIRRSLK